jgi:Mce-associated membrane protein
MTEQSTDAPATPAADPDAVDQRGHGASRRHQTLTVGLLLAALSAVAVGLGIRDHDRRQAAAQPSVPAEQTALAAARAEAVALTTISYKTAARDLDRVLAGATGSLRTQYEREKGQLPGVLAQTKAVSRGTVLSSGLTSLSADTAQALVAVDARVSGADTGRAGVLKHYRMVVTLQRVGDSWLASKVAFAGAPQ